MQFEQGKKLVKYARSVISNHVTDKSIPEIKEFKEKAGVFVTLHTYPEHLLRGCIGIPEPIYQLNKAIREAAISVCHDPRFPKVTEIELPNIVVEVTVLTPPIILSGKHADYPLKISVGIDGLIAEKEGFRGLLLPQVPLEYGWSSIEFLSHTCMKAGLSPDAWKDINTKVYTFQGLVFTEREPNGTIARLELHV